ncbi:MAG: type II toxin-antitoxin system RelE/ParE family toxin [Micrococcaceae bacterium]
MVKGYWKVVAVPEVDEWERKQAKWFKASFDEVKKNLSIHGRKIGRPLVGHIYHSQLVGMKELRIRTIRILFMFGPDNTIVLLASGDKFGMWNKWYKDNIPLAEERYEQYLQERKLR